MTVYNCLKCDAKIEVEYPIIGEVVDCENCHAWFYFELNPDDGELILEYS